MGQRRPKPQGCEYNRRLHRMREIEALVGLRFGKVIPSGADAEPYLLAIAYAANAMGHSLEPVLVGWCGRFAPHLAASVPQILPPIRMQVEGRRYDLADNDVAELLCVTFDERQRLGLRTIGAADISADEMRARVAEARRERERKRQAEKRAKGRQSRADYLASSISRSKPWQIEGVSRRTWYRRLKADGTSVLQGSQETDGTGVLHTRTLSGDATHLCHVSIAPSIDDLADEVGGRVKRPGGTQSPMRDGPARRAGAAGLRRNRYLVAKEGLDDETA